VDAEEKLNLIKKIEKSGALAGTDEAGRGPLAGPVVAAAVVLTLSQREALLKFGLRDSKKISGAKREELFNAMLKMGVIWRAQAAGLEVIERLNINGASLWAMGKSVLKLPLAVDFLVVDGLYTLPWVSTPQASLVAADDQVPAVSAASVVAKVLRDRVMTALDRLYPRYGFARHKGYPTADHRTAVRMFGLSPVHRVSFCRKLTQGS
jgi:ribonuclease HII